MTHKDDHGTLTLSFQTEEEKRLYKEFYLATLTGLISRHGTEQLASISITPSVAITLARSAEQYALRALCEYNITLQHGEITFSY